MMAQRTHTALRDSTRQDDHETIYFAYGSNLSFDQMAARCPKSRFVGCARLNNYRFQINERGFANIVESRCPWHYVEGLCYLLSQRDEEALDRSEGVPTAYRKEEMEVDFLGGSSDYIGKNVVDIVCRRPPMPPGIPSRGPGRHLENAESNGRGDEQEQRTERDATKHRRTSSVPVGTKKTENIRQGGNTWRVKVYLSTNHVRDGLPWDEYISRMEMGLREAEIQGLSSEYIKDVRPWLEKGRGQRPANPRTSSSKTHKTSKRLRIDFERSETNDR
jgi:hypothetical protein